MKKNNINIQKVLEAIQKEENVNVRLKMKYALIDVIKIMNQGEILKKICGNVCTGKTTHIYSCTGYQAQGER